MRNLKSLNPDNVCPKRRTHFVVLNDDCNLENDFIKKKSVRESLLEK